MITRFGKLLRKIRIDNDQILKDMANELNVTVAYLSAVENGKRQVPDSWLSTLIQSYDLSDDEALELQRAAYENKDNVKINLQNSSCAEVDLALSFARKFKNLTDEDMRSLRKILDKK
nr:MAG TPA: helix-turn-helix domain protein [Caudoviricetes sp.]